MFPTDDDPQAAMLQRQELEKVMLEGEAEQRRSGMMWGGPKCWNVEGCCAVNRCTMGGACTTMPNPYR